MTLEKKLYDLTRQILLEEETNKKDNIKSNRRRIRKLFSGYSETEILLAMESIGGCFDNYVYMLPSLCKGIDCDDCYKCYVYKRLMYWRKR